MRPEITTIVEAGLSRELKSLTLALLGEDHRAAALALALIETIEIVCTAAAEEAREAKLDEAYADPDVLLVLPAEAGLETASQAEAAEPKKRTRRSKAEMEAARASEELKQALVDSVAEAEPEEEKVPTLEEARAAIAAASKRLGQPAVFKILSGYGPSLSAFSDKQRQDAMRDLANA